jgi:tetratricopeptide (TPR) repeat protein
LQANRPQAAEQSYELAQRVAAQIGDKKLESFASIGEAEVEARQGKTTDALRLYQNALKLDSVVDDRRSEAADWYTYGLFLRAAGLSPRLAYACLLKSESLMKPYRDTPEFKPIVTAREEMERKLAGRAAEVRRNVISELEEALTLKTQ